MAPKWQILLIECTVRSKVVLRATFWQRGKRGNSKSVSGAHSLGAICARVVARVFALDTHLASKTIKTSSQVTWKKRGKVRWSSRRAINWWTSHTTWSSWWLTMREILHLVKMNIYWCSSMRKCDKKIVALQFYVVKMIYCLNKYCTIWFS